MIKIELELVDGEVEDLKGGLKARKAEWDKWAASETCKKDQEAMCKQADRRAGIDRMMEEIARQVRRQKEVKNG